MATTLSDVSAPPSQKADFWRVALLMAGTVSVLALVGTFSGEKLSFLYKDRLGLSASAVASLGILLAAPTYFRPFIGAGSDLFPLFGYHRRSYYALAVVVNALGYFSLSLLPHYSYWTTALLVIVTVAGGVTLMILADAVMVTVGNRTGTVGIIQSVQQFLPSLLSLALLARLSGYVTQNWSYAHCFRMAALMALLALPLTLLIDEKRVSRSQHERETPQEHTLRLTAKRKERAETLAALRAAAQSPGLWAVVAFVFYLIFTPGTNTAQFYYMVDTLHFSKQFIGNLGQFGSAGTMLGIVAFGAVSRFLPLRAVSLSAWLLDCLLYVLSFALHDKLTAEVLTFAFSFFGIVYTLCLFTLAARACPPKIEGTIYGLVLAAIGLAGTLGEKVGSALYDYYGPVSHHSTAYGWFALNWWGLALTIPAGLLIFWLPKWAKSMQPLAAKSEAAA